MDARSTFKRAWDSYLSSLPEKKRKRKFVHDCCLGENPATAETVNQAIMALEQKSADGRGRRVAKKILGPVVAVLQDYSDIICNMASADPMPTALIWGALKIAIDGIHRYFNLFETIKKELLVLSEQIRRITFYDELYDHSDLLQEIFFRSYLDMIRFWSRVRYGSRLLKAATSFSTIKLNSIIDDIKDDADQIEKVADILERTQGKAERQAAELERYQQTRERLESKQEREAQSTWREQNEVDRQGERYHKISQWLSARSGDENNSTRLRNLSSLHLRGTCEWIFEDETYRKWDAGDIKPSVLWVHAPPASGKSTLSSCVIRAISGAAAPIAYHFYRFDQAMSASETLRLLASQLFDAYWQLNQVVSEEIYLRTHHSVCSLDTVQQLITELVKALPTCYLVLDGMDEECSDFMRWAEAATTVEFLAQLANQYPRVRLWCSSQYRSILNEQLKAYTVLDIKDGVTRDVSLFLSRDNPELMDLEVSDSDKDDVLNSLKARAESNFLWASLMVKSLKAGQETSSLSHLKQFVADGLADNLDEYYRKIFSRFEKQNWSLVSKVFALVAFARRPLRMLELREAVGLLQSKNPLVLEQDSLPFTKHLRTLLSPLIEMQPAGHEDDPDDYTCRLFHSTLRDFLLRNPTILQPVANDAKDLVIDQRVIARTCLMYLFQTRYTHLLRKTDGHWVDAQGIPAHQHQFHLYAAKYWDKHLSECNKTEDLSHRVNRFITSPNFLTCIQVQSLWIDAQFGVFSYTAQKDDRVYLRRMFPRWFVNDTADGKKLWEDLRAFVHEWRYFLCSSRLEDSQSDTLPYAGELDRCWWNVLGPQNFLSRNDCRYDTFSFQSDDSQGLAFGSHFFEGLSSDGNELCTLRLVSRKQAQYIYYCEQWTYSLEGTTKIRSQYISTNEIDTNSRLYSTRDSNSSNARPGSAALVAFSPSNEFLRIGSQIFKRDELGDYAPLVGLSAQALKYPEAPEEMIARDNIVVLASRRVPVHVDLYSTGLSDEKVETLKPFLDNAVKAEREEDSDSDGVEFEFSSSEEDEDEAYETWSEGSTEESDRFADDIISPWAGPPSDLDSDDDHSSASSDSESVVGSEEEDESKTTESSDGEIDPSSIVGYGYPHNDDRDGWQSEDSDSDDSGSNDSGYARYPRHRFGAPKPHPDLKATLDVYDSRSSTRVFHFSRPIPFLLYDSAPAIHPSKPLVVWPLGAGDVLFADYAANTFFIRKLRPSTSFTRHVFMKAHFSPSGEHLHFASLEGQRKPSDSHGKNKNETVPVRLALLLSTYRLSKRKTTTSPPSLIHRARVELGSCLSISVSFLLYTLTWTPTELYFTQSSNKLRVTRLSLFPVAEHVAAPVVRRCPVLIPRKPIFLPDSAQRRRVSFFPPSDGSTTAKIIVGSDSRGRAAQILQQLRNPTAPDDQIPGKGDKKSSASLYSVKHLFKGIQPVGCLVDEEADLGGWRTCHNCCDLPDDLGIAHLDDRLERFDPNDDCDLEPYIE
ncbi:unnamed protein product [Mycena citricolor]|uniref:NACHT domain-containing protein n=1 Tax=Mycena citricolor TaxID=2018698 RepID=A0AAD2GSX3_9AGAR|nr:unnamed protein product [Mycena citricolor]